MLARLSGTQSHQSREPRIVQSPGLTSCSPLKVGIEVPRKSGARGHAGELFSEIPLGIVSLCDV